MVEYPPPTLDRVFGALSDPTRRAILHQLGHHPARVTEIARHFPVSLNAVSKHIMVLEKAGLVQREVQGRDHLCRLDGHPLQIATLWMQEVQSFWEQRLDALERHVAERRRKPQ